VNWITIASGASGSGSGAVSYTVAANTGTSSRSGTLTVAGQTFTVTQAAGASGPQPAINAGGVVNAADYTANFAPGIIFSTFGKNLASGTRAATSVPLPASLDGVSVEVIDGSRTLVAPLFFVSAEQINAQLPFDISGTSVQMRVRTAQGVSNAQTIDILARAPRLFTKTLDGHGEAIVVHADYTLVTADNPAAPLEMLVLYLTGLGAVSPSIAAGQAGGDGTAGRPLNLVKDEVQVEVNGNPAVVYFAGLAPYFVGLYQINFQVPEDTPQRMAVITVRAGGQESQFAVGFTCDRKWQAVASASIGTGGGVLTAGQLTLTVPAGGLASSSEIKVAQAPAETAPQPDRGSPLYRITGLPATTSAPITVSIVAAGPVSSNDTYIVVEEPYGGEMFLKAKVEGNRATVTLPPRQAVPLALAAKSPSSRALVESAPRFSQELSPEASGILVFVLLNVRTKLSPNEMFEVFYTTGSLVGDAQASDIGRVLENAVYKLGNSGFFSGEYMPWAYRQVPVSIGKSSDLLEPWGSVRRSSWNGETSLRLDYEYIQTARSWTKVAPGADLLQAWAGHLVFHLMLHLRDPKVPFTRHPWLWMDEAVAAWFEHEMAGVSNYVPIFWLGGVGDSSRPWWDLQSTGLEFPPLESPPIEGPFRNSEAEEIWRMAFEGQFHVRAHGCWASTFIHYLNARRAETWLGFLYLLRGPAGVGPSPVEALQSYGVNFGAQWVSFWEEFAGGLFYGSGGVRKNPGPAFDLVSDRFSSEPRVALGGEKAQTRTISRLWVAPDLSATAYYVVMPDSWPKKSTLTVSATGAGAVVVIREIVRGKINSPSGDIPDKIGAQIGGASSKVTIELDTFTPGRDLLVVVVNPRAVKPFRSTTPVVIEFALKAETGGAACTNDQYKISPTSASIAADGGSGSVTVTAPSGCAWTAASNANWITITSGVPGAGNGTVQYSVAANTSTSSRTGTLTIAGQTFTVTQAGAAPPPPGVPAWLKDLSKASVRFWNIPFDCTCSACSVANVVAVVSWSYATTEAPAADWKRLTWNGLTFSLDATYRPPNVPGATIRIEISGTLSADFKVLETLRIKTTVTSVFSTYYTVSQVEVIAQLIPVTSFQENQVSFALSKALYNATPSQYVTNAVATYTTTYGGGGSCTQKPDWSRFRSDWSPDSPIEVNLSK
jgi:uncharacterized protein (TIGR03437 family)